jgi:uncharacterized protein (DUF1330 family)
MRMAAYAVVDIDVTDPQAYEAYKAGAAKSIADYGGRYLVRGGRTETLEGAWSPKRFVIIEFPTMERLKEWYSSPEYKPLLDVRKRASVSKLVVAEGV